MKMFDFLKRKNKKEELEMTEDEKEIKKAETDIDEKGKDSQTEKDRVDESVGEQEKNSGNENSQNAKDRVDESEGTKKADEKRTEEKKERNDDKFDRFFSRMEQFFESIDKRLSSLEKTSKEEVKELDEDSEAEKKAEEIYGVGNGVFQGTKASSEKTMTPADVAKVVNKIMK